MKAVRWVYWSPARRRGVILSLIGGIAVMCGLMILSGCQSSAPPADPEPTVTVTVDTPTGVAPPSGTPDPSASTSPSTGTTRPAVPVHAAIQTQASGFLTAWLSGRTAPALSTWTDALAHWALPGAVSIMSTTDLTAIPDAKVKSLTVALSDPQTAYVTVVLSNAEVLTVTMALSDGVWLASDLAAG